MAKRQTILTPTQVKILGVLSAEPLVAANFVLSGGTALAEWYLRHRYSEDLDFFSQNEFSSETIPSILKKHKDILDFENFDIQKSFNRNLVFVKYPLETVKLEFTYFPFPSIETGLKYGNIKIDSLKDIAANKLFTIYQQPRTRDFIDLYLIMQRDVGLLWDQLLKLAMAKFECYIDPLQMGTRLYECTQITDYPKMIVPIEDTLWQKFFLSIAKQLGNQISSP